MPRSIGRTSRPALPCHRGASSHCARHTWPRTARSSRLLLAVLSSSSLTSFLRTEARPHLFIPKMGGFQWEKRLYFYVFFAFYRHKQGFFGGGLPAGRQA